MYEEYIWSILLIVGSILLNLFVLKRMISDEKIMDKIDLILSNMVNDVEMQKKVYLLGTLLGSGIAKGSGIAGSGGKIKLEDVIAQGAAQFIGGMFKQPIRTNETQQGALP